MAFTPGGAASNLGGAAHPAAKVPSADPVNSYWESVQQALNSGDKPVPKRSSSGLSQSEIQARAIVFNRNRGRRKFSIM